MCVYIAAVSQLKESKRARSKPKFLALVDTVDTLGVLVCDGFCLLISPMLLGLPAG